MLFHTNNLKDKICPLYDTKHCGKKEKCWSPAFSHFSHNVFEALLFLKLFNTLPHNPIFKDPEKEPFENIVGKGENAFSPFPAMFFYPPQK